VVRRARRPVLDPTVPGTRQRGPGHAATPKRPRCAVLGHPVGHSLSPLLHRAAYAALGLDWEYAAVDVDADGLAGFIDGLDGRWRGLSLTMPLKWAVLPLLDELDPVAATVGTVNTLVLGPHRPGARPLRRGINTDVAGVASALAGSGAPAADVVVLGAGATACSVLAALDRAADITVLARDPARTGRLREVADRLDRPVRIGRLPDATSGRATFARPDLLVSTLPGGALPAVDPGLVPGPGGTVFDVVYDGWPTPLARAGTAAGARVVSGLDLLVAQAVGQVQAMTGRTVDAPVLTRVLADALVAAGVAGAAGLAGRTCPPREASKRG